MAYRHTSGPEALPEGVRGPDSSGSGRWAMAMHGGAGEISDKSSVPARMAEFTSIEAAGRKMLSEGATAMDTVEYVVSLLEDCVYFNAGRGSVFTHTGTHEMDACIMDGTLLRTGACSNVHNIRNPIKLARVVAEKTQHCLLSGPGAEALADKHNVTSEDNAYFHTDERYKQLLAARKTGEVVLDHGGALRQDTRSYAETKPSLIASNAVGRPHHGTDPHTPRQKLRDAKLRSADQESAQMRAAAEGEALGFVSEEKFSTVGCVCRDKYGNLAAAGSTGGLCNKQPGRVGDTPIVGAGVFANSSTCAVACTGHGETFLKNSVAFDVHSRIKLAGMAMSEAMNTIMLHELPPHTGGIVGVSAEGEAYACYNTSGMFTGLSDWTGKVEVYHKEDLSVDRAISKRIVPHVVDSFISTGTLKVLYLHNAGGVSKLLVPVSPAMATDPINMVQEPSVFWAEPMSITEVGKVPRMALFTLIMVQVSADSSEQKLGWMVCDIVGNELNSGTEVVEYKVDPTDGVDESGTAAYQYLFLLAEQTQGGSLCAGLGDDYRWGQDFNARAFVKLHKLQVVMGNFCSSEVVNLSASESMPDLALAAAGGDNTEEMHSVMDTGSGELLDGVQPLTTSDSLATLTLHAEVDAGLDTSQSAELQSEMEAEAPQSLAEAAVAIAQAAEQLEEQAGDFLSELEATNTADS